MDAKVLARYKINKRILRKNCLKKKESDRKEEKEISMEDTSLFSVSSDFSSLWDHSLCLFLFLS